MADILDENGESIFDENELTNVVVCFSWSTENIWLLMATKTELFSIENSDGIKLP